MPAEVSKAQSEKPRRQPAAVRLAADLHAAGMNKVAAAETAAQTIRDRKIRRLADRVIRKTIAVSAELVGK